jgi:hypothetical protein
LVCGNLLGIASWPQANLGELLPYAFANEQSPADFGLVRPSYLRLKTLRKSVSGRPLRNFQDLRVMSMTKNQKTQAAIPHQDIRILNCLARFSSPRGRTMQYSDRRVATRLRRNSHGVARAIEGLRGLRRSLVPCPDPWQHLLPEVCNKTERLSITREPQASWASNAFKPQAAHQSMGGG